MISRTTSSSLNSCLNYRPNRDVRKNCPSTIYNASQPLNERSSPMALAGLFVLPLFKPTCYEPFFFTQLPITVSTPSFCRESTVNGTNRSPGAAYTNEADRLQLLRASVAQLPEYCLEAVYSLTELISKPPPPPMFSDTFARNVHLTPTMFSFYIWVAFMNISKIAS